MIALILLSALWFSDNAEFVKTVNEQLADGYKWKEVGKTEASGTPAITLKTETNEYIFYRLEK